MLHNKANDPYYIFSLDILNALVKAKTIKLVGNFPPTITFCKFSSFCVVILLNVYLLYKLFVVVILLFVFYSRLLITPLVSSNFSAASLLSKQNKNQIKQNRAKPHTFTSLHMGFVILYLHFLANTVFSHKPVTICSMLEDAQIA
jgi:membrane protein insertase Oxa1/YidC/SpoIIIJ